MDFEQKRYTIRASDLFNFFRRLRVALLIKSDKLKVLALI